MSDATFTSWHPRVLQVESEGSQPSPKELREQAQEEGYAQGYAEGLEAGRKESNIQANAKIAQLQSLVDALDRPFHQQELKVSEYLLSLVSTICSSILRRDAERIRDTLDRALELLSGERGQVTLLLHPDDMAAVTDTWSDDLGELRVEPAPDVIRGGCRIHRNDSLVDATVETQLRNTIMDLARIPGPVGSSGEPGDLLDGAEVQSVINRLEAGGNDSD